MSQFNYRQLDETFPDDRSQTGVAVAADDQVQVITSLTDDSTTASPTMTSTECNDLEDELGHIYNDYPQQSNVKYTALKPTSNPRGVPYLEDDGCNAGDESLDSVIQLQLLPPGRKRKCSKVNAAICILLCILAALAMLALIYVLVIFPSNSGKVTFSDGLMHTEELAKLHKLGAMVTMTSCGLVRGAFENGAYVFKGIPYAVSPIGSKRWKAPVAMNYHTNSCWTDVLNATQFGSECVQPKYDDINAIQGSEDCLFLNVWTPSLVPSKNMPVLVWLHSGDFVHGSGHMPGMSPSPDVAIATNAVYVSMNYRLGAFGFLALDVLRDKFRGPSGNYGLMDQILALRWVQENIRHFGGDEFDVTIFGHGSGATSVQALLQSGRSYQLFHKVWMASPTAILNKTLNEACEDNKKFLTTSGCKSSHCLRSLSPLAVSRASPWSLSPFWTIDEIFHVPYHSQVRNELAIFDGEIVHWTPSDIGPQGIDVPVMMGTTYFELSNLKTEAAVINLTEESYNSMLVDKGAPLGTDAVIQIKKIYSDQPRMQYTNHFPSYSSASFAHLIGDVKNVCPLRILSQSIDFLYSSPVYMYTAEIYPSHNILVSSSEVNSFIGWDLLAFFNGFSELDFHPGQGDLNFMLLLREEIMSFIRNGKPSASRWKPVNKTIGIIGRDITVRPAPSNYFEHCKFWKRHGYFKYTWSKTM